MRPNAGMLERAIVLGALMGATVGSGVVSGVIVAAILLEGELGYGVFAVCCVALGAVVGWPLGRQREQPRRSQRISSEGAYGALLGAIAMGSVAAPLVGSVSAVIAACIGAVVGVLTGLLLGLALQLLVGGSLRIWVPASRSRAVWRVRVGGALLAPLAFGAASAILLARDFALPRLLLSMLADVLRLRVDLPRLLREVPAYVRDLLRLLAEAPQVLRANAGIAVGLGAVCVVIGWFIAPRICASLLPPHADTLTLPTSPVANVPPE